MAKRALVVDDEKAIVKGIKFSLEKDGLEVDCAYDGEEGLRLATEGKYDIILLDVMLPGLDGFEVCQRIREFSDVPVIMLTAKGDDMDKILGLEYGADDYITKPFNILEVKARIKAIMRRAVVKEEDEHQPGTDGLSIDVKNRRVLSNGREINLTGKEMDLLLVLAETPGKIFAREELLKAVWGADYAGDARTVDVHMRRLREKLEDNPGDPRHVLTRWGSGYYFRE